MEIQVEKLPKALKQTGLEKRLSESCEKNDVAFLAVFGSFVRGEQKYESDVDIAIEFEKDERKTLLDLLRLENELSEVFKRKVDLGVFSSLNPYIADDIKKEMLVIY